MRLLCKHLSSIKMQAFSLWPKVWPTPEALVLQGFRKFMHKLSIVTTTVIAVCYILIYPSHFYFALILYVMMFFALNSVAAKIEKRMNLLRDWSIHIKPSSPAIWKGWFYWYSSLQVETDASYNKCYWWSPQTDIVLMRLRLNIYGRNYFS